jgi:protein O-GlcNAc transferase
MFASLKKKLFGDMASKPAEPVSAAAPPSEAEAKASELKKRGNAQREQGHLEEAARCYRHAMAVAPNDVGALVNLGFALSELGQFEEARSHLEKAAALDPKQDDALYLLGTIERATGEPYKAIERFRSTLALKPDFSLCRLDLCRLLFEYGHAHEARQVAAAGIAIEPNSADLHYYLGNLHHEARELNEAVACFERALALQPDYAEVYGNLANSLQERGDLDRAIYCAGKALQLQPGIEEAQNNLLFALNYHPDKNAQEIFAAYREYDKRVGLPLRSTWREHANSRDATKRLKVGYVSPDFRQHPVRYFLEPLLAHHDKRAVEVFAYAELLLEDAATTRYRTHVDHWIATAGLSDEVLAERIRSDGIDILLDLAGHTGKNRLGVFARKPAPVSMSWLGFGYTTGLSAINYFLTDDACAPEGCEDLFAEQPWRLTTPGYAYRPAEGMGHVGSLPAQERGFVTFGTLTRSVRINHRSIRVWSQILHRVPGARLVMDSMNYRDARMCATLLDRFSAHGIGPERLQIGFHSPPWDVLRGMDIGLDCFPHNSGTTLFETLFMGVPYVTLAGRPSVGRLGSSIVIGAGHPEWIARSEDEYVDISVALASDLPALAALRAGLRAQMQASAVMDEPGFARKVEAAYREMFSRWAAGSA